MAGAPQAMAGFPGIKYVRGGEFTLTHGTNPSSFRLSITPQFGIPPAVGNLVLTWGGERVVFPSCRIDSANFVSNQSGQLVSLNILDRRWKWRFPRLSGHYNVRERDGELRKMKNPENPNNAIENTEKTPQELARMLFDALGERGASVADMPNDIRPEVHWEQARADRELANLCELVGCRVVLDARNRVAIRVLNDDASIPRGPIISQAPSIDPVETADRVEVVTAPIRYLVDLPLRAVGLDEDETIKPIDDLSYKPEDGWILSELTEFGDIKKGEDYFDKEMYRGLARKSMFRWFQVYVPKGRSIKVHGYQDQTAGDGAAQGRGVYFVDQFVIHPTQAIPLWFPKEEEEQKKHWRLEKPPIVYGIWHNEADYTVPLVNVVDKLTPPKVSSKNEKTYRKDIVPYSFSIDPGTYMVIFSEPVYRITEPEEDDSNTSFAEEPTLVLRTSVSIRTRKEAAFARLVFGQDTGYRNGTQPFRIIEDSLTPTIIPKYKGPSYNNPEIVTNFGLIGRTAKQIVKHHIASSQTRNATTVNYAGWIAPQLNGAIQSVSWEFSEAGATTTVQIGQDLGTNSSLPFNLRRQAQRRGDIRDIQRAIKESQRKEDS